MNLKFGVVVRVMIILRRRLLIWHWGLIAWNEKNKLRLMDYWFFQYRLSSTKSVTGWVAKESSSITSLLVPIKLTLFIFKYRVRPLYLMFGKHGYGFDFYQRRNRIVEGSTSYNIGKCTLNRNTDRFTPTEIEVFQLL